MSDETPTVTETASVTPSIRIVKPVAPVKEKAPKVAKPAKVENVVRYYDSAKNLLGTTKMPRGAKPSYATKEENGDWSIFGCHQQISAVDGLPEIVLPLIEKPKYVPKAKPEVFYLTLDAMGNVTLKEPRGRGQSRKGWVKREDGNYVQSSAPIPNAELPIGASVIDTNSEEAVTSLSDRLKQARMETTETATA